MKNHIDILTLFDYARGKISDDQLYDQITDHLGECNHCHRVLKSHEYLIANEDFVLERLFPSMETATEAMSAEALPVSGLRISAADQVKTVIQGIQELVNKARIKGGEIREQVMQFVEEIKLLADLQEKLIAIPARQQFLGIDDEHLDQQKRKKPGEKQLRFQGNSVRIGLMPGGSWDLDDFIIEFAGICFYILYEKENFETLVGKVVTLTVNEYPYLVEATFERAGNLASAKFDIAFEPSGTETDEAGKKADGILELYLFINE